MQVSQLLREWEYRMHFGVVTETDFDTESSWAYHFVLPDGTNYGNKYQIVLNISNPAIIVWGGGAPYLLLHDMARRLAIQARYNLSMGL